jgi:hypothetical protein
LDDDLPGAELVSQGLIDLAAGLETVPALLVAIGAPRLRAELPVPENPFDEPNLRLYHLLGRSAVDDPYAAYNALIRRLTRYERALEGRAERRRRQVG